MVKWFQTVRVGYAFAAVGQMFVALVRFGIATLWYGGWRAAYVFVPVVVLLAALSPQPMLYERPVSSWSISSFIPAALIEGGSVHLIVTPQERAAARRVTRVYPASRLFPALVVTPGWEPTKLVWLYYAYLFKFLWFGFCVAYAIRRGGVDVFSPLDEWRKEHEPYRLSTTDTTAAHL